MTKTNNDKNIYTKKKERNYGIDILRILSMFMVTLLHFCGHSGIGDNPDAGMPFYVGSVFLVVCYGAVNVFALISGYVIYDSNIRYSRIISLWLQVVFYSVGLSAIEKFAYGTYINIFSLFMPLAFSNLWYFQAYFLMFFFIPLYNAIVKKLQNKELLKFIFIGIIIFCLFSNYAIMANKDILGLRNGYSFLWLSFCYIVGAFIQKNKSSIQKISNRACWFLICISELINYLSYVLLFDISGPESLYINPKYIFVRYTSVTVFVPAICVLIIFSRIKVNRGKKVIKIFSSTAFAVYIIQLHTLVWDHYIRQYGVLFKNIINAWTSIPLLIAGAVALFITATVVEYLRIQLFRLLHIDELCNLICKLFEKIINAARKPIKKYIQI